ncbi:MAG: hypothetical protein ABI434_15290 [Burkholderiaceae bacterium]
MKKLFRGSTPAPLEPTGAGLFEPTVHAPAGAAHAPRAQDDFDAQVDTRRELLRVRTRNTLRLSGIPESWVEAQVLLEPAGGRTFMHLRLGVRHWDPRLLCYAVAFQRKLMQEIERIDPQAAQWLLSIVWSFPPELECPYPELPQPSAWLDHEARPSQLDELQSDLALLYAVRDAELAHPGASKGQDAG